MMVPQAVFSGDVIALIHPAVRLRLREFRVETAGIIKDLTREGREFFASRYNAGMGVR